MNVHFICRGNVLRSLIAETYLKSLHINGVDVISSGTSVDWNNPQEREFFSNTLEVFRRHGIHKYAKNRSNQLDQTRVDSHNDIIVLMNERVLDEAKQLVQFPTMPHNWMIVDIGEGHRTNHDDHEQYEEEIYQEITQKVDVLFADH